MYPEQSFNVIMFPCPMGIILHQQTFSQIVLGFKRLGIKCLLLYFLKSNPGFWRQSAPGFHSYLFAGFPSLHDTFRDHLRGLTLGKIIFPTLSTPQLHVIPFMSGTYKISSFHVEMCIFVLFVYILFRQHLLKNHK